MTVTMKANQKVTLTAAGNDPDGDGVANPLPGAPSWTVVSGSFVNLAASTDGLTCQVIGSGIGTSVVRCAVPGLAFVDTTVVTTDPIVHATAVVVTAGTPV